MRKGVIHLYTELEEKYIYFYTIFVWLVTLCTGHAGALCDVLPGVNNVGYVSASSTAGGG